VPMTDSLLALLELVRVADGTRLSERDALTLTTRQQAEILLWASKQTTAPGLRLARPKCLPESPHADLPWWFIRGCVSAGVDPHESRDLLQLTDPGVYCEQCGALQVLGSECHGDDQCTCGPDGGKAMACLGWGRYCCQCGADFARSQLP
jgi:hypothetical protein